MKKNKTIEGQNFKLPFKKFLLVIKMIVVLICVTGLIGAMAQQGKKVSGKITDQTGASVPGATVLVKGTTTGVVTDMDGTYSLNNVPEKATLQITFIGMKGQEVAVNGRSTINVTLEAAVTDIDEVVVVGYGTQKRANVVGAVASVDGEKLQSIYFSGWHE